MPTPADRAVHVIKKNADIVSSLPKHVVKDRITVVESVYHQARDQEAVRTETRFSRNLETEEQPYDRQLKATEQWSPLVDNKCWIASDKCGLLLVRNDEGGRTNRIPSEEQRLLVALRVLEIAYFAADVEPPSGPVAHGWTIHPRESQRCQPNSLQGLMVRCKHGEARYTLRVYPI